MADENPLMGCLDHRRDPWEGNCYECSRCGGYGIAPAPYVSVEEVAKLTKENERLTRLVKACENAGIVIHGNSVENRLALNIQAAYRNKEKK